MKKAVIKYELDRRKLPIYETDISYIQDILYTINHAEEATKAFPNLNEEVPITIVDKRLML